MDDSQRGTGAAEGGKALERREFLRRASVLLAAGPLGLAACGGGSSGAKTAAGTATGAKAAAGNGKVTTWYLTGSPAEAKYITGLSDQFGTAHKVKTSVTPYDYDPINRQLKLAFSAGKGPDVAYANPSPDDQFVYQEKGWIIDLAPAAKQRDWLSRQAPDVTSYWNHQCCKDVLSGIPFDLAAVGWFYNPEIFDKHGLKVPTTFEEFESNLAALKTAGVIPVAAGGLSASQPGSIGYSWEQPVHAIVDRAKLFALEARDPNAKWTDPGIVQALGYAQSWVHDKGYFEKDPLATSGPDADALFTTGKAAMIVNGTWKTADYIKDAKFDVGFFAMPMINSDLPPQMGGYSPNNQWMISSKAGDPAAALDYVDYMLGEEAATTLWENGDIPAFKFKTPPAAKSKVQSDIYAAMGKHKTGVFMANVGGFFTEQYRAVIQKLLAGNASPAETAQTLQDNYEKTLKQQ